MVNDSRILNPDGEIPLKGSVDVLIGRSTTLNPAVGGPLSDHSPPADGPA